MSAMRPAHEWSRSRPGSAGRLAERLNFTRVAVRLPLQDHDLMPQREDLGVLIPVTYRAAGLGGQAGW
jgi:hypothetical protein